MTRAGYSRLHPPESQSQSNTARDSLELASLASSSHGSGPFSRSSSPAGISSSRKQSLETRREGETDEADGAQIRTPGQRRSTHNRAYSVSSAFDFTSNLFPLSSTVLGGYAPIGAPTTSSLEAGGGSLEKHKSLSYLNGLSLVIGLIIGSGIFSSPAQVNLNAGSPGASLLVWAIAGTLAWTGAASYAELGGAIPLNGGAQIYLSKIFGELAGFLFTWSAVGVLKPGSAAIIAIIFGEYVVRAVVGPDMEGVSSWINKGVALAGLFLVTLFNCLSTKLSTRMADTFMFFKFAALIGITVTGVVVAITGFSWRGTPNLEWKTRGWFEGTSLDISSWAVALYAGLWAFDGWDNVNYVVAEFHNPHRDLPRVLHTSMFLVLISYLLANISYFLVLPLSTLTSTSTVAVQFGSQTFGPLGSLILALTVSLSCFGALNATTFTSGRLVYVAGQEGLLPSVFGTLSVPTLQKSTSTSLTGHSPNRWARFLGATASQPLWHTPVAAFMLNASLTALYIVIGSFATLVTFYGVAGYTFYFLTVLGLIVLRVREPALDRPYRTWITTPIIFCCVSLFLLSRAVVSEPAQTVLVAGFVGAGVPVWWWGVRRGKRSGNGSRTGQRRKGAVGVGTGARWKFWRRWTS